MRQRKRILEDLQRMRPESFIWMHASHKSTLTRALRILKAEKPESVFIVKTFKGVLARHLAVIRVL